MVKWAGLNTTALISSPSAAAEALAMLFKVALRRFLICNMAVWGRLPLTK